MLSIRKYANSFGCVSVRDNKMIWGKPKFSIDLNRQYKHQYLKYNMELVIDQQILTTKAHSKSKQNAKKRASHPHTPSCDEIHSNFQHTCAINVAHVLNRFLYTE